MRDFFKYTIPVALVCSVGAGGAGAWSWPWENKEEKSDDDLKVLYLQDGFFGRDADSFKSFPMLVKNFIYRSESGKSYEVDISRQMEDRHHPFKVIIREKDSAGNRKDLAFWILHGENLPTDLEENVKSWIELKETSDAIGEILKKDPSVENDFVDLKCDMAVCVEHMNACRNYGFWTVYVLEDGSMKRLGTGN